MRFKNKTNSNSIQKYELPKILAIDMDEEEIMKLKEEGFNIEVGTFGYGYRCNQYDECYLNGSLPHITEKDIVIIDLDEKKTTIENESFNSELTKADRTVPIVPRGQNYFKPSYLFANQYKSEIKKILYNGGIIIIFADEVKEETYYIRQYSHDNLSGEDTVKLSNYNWLPVDIFPHSQPCGNIVIPFSEDNQLMKFSNEVISENKDEIEYKCIFETSSENQFNLFKNKLDETVGYIEIVKNNDKIGCLVVLPQFLHKYKPLLTLFKELLPSIKPELFPEFVQNNWLREDEYILPKVKNIITKRDKVKEEYEEKIKNLDKEIVETEEKLSFSTNILIAQGYSGFLVDNVKKVLEFIGYKNVIDVDKELEGGNRQEDLRIRDNDRFDVIEVKGHKGKPTEDDCQAVVKYMSRQMREQDRTDIYGILIVNHQRLLPPMNRENPAFTLAQIEDAKRDNYNLVSTLELYKAIRLLQEGILSFDEIDRELHKSGLFQAIPSTWQSVGKIERLINKDNIIACLYLAVDVVKINDEIVIQDDNNYFIQRIEEMMVDEVKVEKAIKGQPVSIKINNVIKKKANIYLKK